MPTTNSAPEGIEKNMLDHAAFYRMIWRWRFYAGLRELA